MRINSCQQCNAARKGGALRVWTPTDADVRTEPVFGVRIIRGRVANNLRRHSKNGSADPIRDIESPPKIVPGKDGLITQVHRLVLGSGRIQKFQGSEEK